MSRSDRRTGVLTLQRLANQNRTMNRFVSLMCLVGSLAFLLRGAHVLLNDIAPIDASGSSVAYAQGYLHGQMAAGWVFIAAAGSCAFIAWRRTRAGR